MGEQPVNMAFGDHNSGIQIGQNFAPIHLAPERPETPPIPSTNVSHRRDPNFVERDDLLNRIDQKLAIAAARVALVGLGGVGKTQQAVEYSYHVRDRSRDKWVLWINASSASQFEQSVRNIIERVRIKGRKDANADIFQLFRAWLEDPGKGSWMVVLDNADDAAFLVNKPTNHEESTTTSLYACLPVCEHGSVLITTRSRRAALQLVESDDIIRMHPMDEDHTIRLLENKLGIDVNHEDLKRLAAALEYIPLAVSQAAAYLKRKEWKNSVQHYLAQLKYHNDLGLSNSETDGEESHGPLAATQTVTRTWQISFEHLRTSRQSAADLLSLMSLCDRQGIPEVLLSVQDNVPARKELEEDVETLLGYSFISVSSDGSTFGMHRLVQLATRSWLGMQNDMSRHIQRLVTHLEMTFPSGEYDTWSTCECLLPHAKTALDLMPEDPDEQLRWASVMYRSAKYASIKGGLLMLGQGIEMCQASWETRKSLLGENDQATLESMRLLAKCYSNIARYQEAFDLGEKCFTASFTHLGALHEDTLASMSDLASFSEYIGNLRKAAELEHKCYSLRRERYGEEHEHTLQSMRDLTRYLWDLGERDQAVETMQRCYEIQKRTLGEIHPETLESSNYIAWYYHELGDTDKALAMELVCWETRERVLGPTHVATLRSLNNIALYYQSLEQHEKGIEMGERCWTLKKEVLGEMHDSTLTSLHNLAIYHHDIGNDGKAIELAEHCYETRLKTFGPDHLSTVGEMGNLAACYAGFQDYARAIETSKRCWELRALKLGKDHPNTLQSMNNLAWYYRLDDQLPRAIPLLEQCVALTVSKLGEDDPYTRQRVCNLAFLKEEAAKKAAPVKKRHIIVDKFRKWRS